jgi:hypothetical protein
VILLWVIAIWLLLAVVGFLNGVTRRVLLTPWLGESLARQVSSVTAAALILAVVIAVAPALRGLSRRELLAVGSLWLALTVAFELTLGRLTGQTWSRLLEDYDLSAGRLWVLVPLTVLFAPLVAARLGGHVSSPERVRGVRPSSSTSRVARRSAGRRLT